MTKPKEQESDGQRVRLFRNGRSQAVRIPKDLEFSGNEVVLRKEGERLILEPVPRRSGLLRALSCMKATDEQLPDVDNGVRQLDDIKL